MPNPLEMRFLSGKIIKLNGDVVQPTLTTRKWTEVVNEMSVGFTTQIGQPFCSSGFLHRQSISVDAHACNKIEPLESVQGTMVRLKGKHTFFQRMNIWFWFLLVSWDVGHVLKIDANFLPVPDISLEGHESITVAQNVHSSICRQFLRGQAASIGTWIGRVMMQHSGMPRSSRIPHVCTNPCDSIQLQWNINMLCRRRLNTHGCVYNQFDLQTDCTCLFWKPKPHSQDSHVFSSYCALQLVSKQS